MAQLPSSASPLDSFARSGDTQPPRPTSPPSAPRAFSRPIGAQKVAVHRDEARILRMLKAAAITAGEEWFYYFPVPTRSQPGLSYVEGPSIKMTSDLARLYGNCAVETHVIDLGDAWVIDARFSDLETGYSLSRPHQQGKPRDGLTGRALESALQAAISKAIRNVVATALPTFTEFGLREARKVVLSTLEADFDMERRRTISAMTGVIAVEDGEALLRCPMALWSAADLHQLRSVLRALNDGMLGIRDLPLSAPAESRRPETEEGASDALNRFAAAPTAPLQRPEIVLSEAGGSIREPETGREKVSDQRPQPSAKAPGRRKRKSGEPRPRKNRARTPALSAIIEGLVP